MLPCASLLIVLPYFAATFGGAFAAIENDTAVVGSFVHETKIKAPGDLLSAASKKHKHHGGESTSDDFGDVGYKRSHSTRDNDGYSTFDTFHNKDGDGFGYAQHFEFGKKNGGKKQGGYHENSNFDDEDEAAGSVSPKFSEWHFEKESGSPAKSYRYQSDDGDSSSLGKLVGPDYEYGGSKKSSKGKRAKRKKDNVQPAAATEYDNYEYADTEEPEEAPADFEAEESPDPEYGALYAEGDAYDYY